MAHPDVDHRIIISPYGGRVTVWSGGSVVADSHNALALAENGYPTAYYLPRADIPMERFSRSDHTTHCPFKGDATYYNVEIDGLVIENAVWSYETPFDAVAEIAGHLSFYRDRFSVDVTGD